LGETLDGKKVIVEYSIKNPYVDKIISFIENIETSLIEDKPIILQPNCFLFRENKKY